MTRKRWLMGMILTAGAAFTMASAETQEKCCFTHPSFSGTCEVTTGEGETCASVLAYLNTPNSQGRTYCRGSDLRGGWKLVSCDEP